MSNAEHDPLLELLKQEISADRGSVRPLAPAWARGLFLIPLWAASAAAVVVLLGYRADYETLGPIVAWSLVAVQVGGAYLLLIIGLRLVIPAAALPRSTVIGGVGLAAIIHLTLALATFRLSPVLVPEGLAWQLGIACFTSNVALSLLPIIIGMLLAWRGLPGNPLAVGLLCGLAAGLAGEAVWRMHCPYSDLQHILPAHSGATLALALTGIVSGYLLQRMVKRRLAIRPS